MNKMRNLKSLQVVVSIIYLLVLACGQITSVAPTLTLIPAPNSTNTVTPIPANINTDDRHVESEGGFSYIPPVGWQIVEFPGLKYKMVIGKTTANFSPNLNFTDEIYIGSLDSYVSTNLEGFNKTFISANIISQENFKTDNGESAIKIITENTPNEKRLRQTFYFFAVGDKKFVIAYTRLPDTGEENDVLVDQSIKTFRVDK